MYRSPERKDVQITIRIPSSIREALAKVAAKERRSVSEVILIYVEEGLARAKKKGGR